MPTEDAKPMPLYRTVKTSTLAAGDDVLDFFANLGDAEDFVVGVEDGANVYPPGPATADDIAEADVWPWAVVATPTVEDAP